MNARAHRPTPQEGLKGVTVLVVDDSQSMRELLKTILRELGVGQVLMAIDGAEGMSILRELKPDMVFVDWMMKPVDGYEFVRLVRTAPDSPNRTIPIIMLTGHTEKMRVHAARDIGVTEFLAKPVSPKAVAQRIESIIHRDRPFVQTSCFFGPDRRRKVASFDGPDLRNRSADGDRIVTRAELQHLLEEDDEP